MSPIDEVLMEIRSRFCAREDLLYCYYAFPTLKQTMERHAHSGQSYVECLEETIVQLCKSIRNHEREDEKRLLADVSPRHADVGRLFGLEEKV